MWEDINGLYYNVSRFNPQDEIAAGPHRFCDEIKFGAHRFHGVTDATLPHDEGWQFLRVGWSLERAEMTARLVDVQYHNLLEDFPPAGGSDNHQWMAVLNSVGAYEAYHRQYHSPIEPEKVAEMLILHPLHPRSIRFSASEVQSGLRASAARARLLRERSRAPAGESSRTAQLRQDRRNLQAGLHGYLEDLLQMCGSIGDDIARTYFYYAVVA